MIEGATDLRRELLQITEGIRILIAEIETVEKRLTLIEWAREVGIGATRIEAPSR